MPDFTPGEEAAERRGRKLLRSRRSPWSEADWARLGQFLRERRAALDERYALNHQLFARERGINWRLSWDAENAVGAGRMNISAETLRYKVDRAYGVPPGTSESVLAGPQSAERCRPAPVTPARLDPVLADLVARHWGSPEQAPESVRSVLRLRESDFSTQEKLAVIADIARRNGPELPGRGENSA
jgi:hypothetical protein